MSDLKKPTLNPKFISYELNWALVVKMGKIIAILVCIASYALNISAQENAELPIVDIGYRFHQASFNVCNNAEHESGLH
jgi:hypothetical protein